MWTRSGRGEEEEHTAWRLSPEGNEFLDGLMTDTTQQEAQAVALLRHTGWLTNLLVALADDGDPDRLLDRDTFERLPEGHGWGRQVWRSAGEPGDWDYYVEPVPDAEAGAVVFTDGDA